VKKERIVIMDIQNNIQTSEPLKQFSFVIIKGKKKIFITNEFSGEDKRKEASDVIGNKRV